MGALCVVLGAFVVAGARLVPFHGDESIWLYMSRDLETYFVQGNVSALLYTDAPANPEDQSLRELNNPLAKYVIGLSRRAGGYDASEVNGYWVWGADWEWNRANGRVPSQGLLQAGRWLPAAVAALALPAVVALGTWLRSWVTGALAALLLALDASFLLHARRAMAEGVLVALGTLSVALVAAYVARRSVERPLPTHRRFAWLLAIGLLAGLAVATKLTGALAAGVVGLALVGLAPWRDAPRVALERAGTDVAVVAGVALACVLALSPFLWVRPLARIGETLRDMTQLIEGQSRDRDVLASPGQRAGALVQEVFWTQPSYYEDAVWSEWVGDQIERYEASPLSGWRRPVWARVVLGGAFVVGLVWLATRPTSSRVVRNVLLLWLGVTAAANLAIIPFAWQRYYLPLWPGVAMVEAVGLAVVAGTVGKFLTGRRGGNYNSGA